MTEITKQFGTAVRAARASLGWSQERLAQEAGLDRTYISGVERGRRNPSLLTQQRIATALRVTLAQLLSDAGNH